MISEFRSQPVQPYTIRVLEYSPIGLVTSSSNIQVQLNPNEIRDVGLVITPRPPATSGVPQVEVTKATLTVSNGTVAPQVVIEGKNFTIPSEERLRQRKVTVYRYSFNTDPATVLTPMGKSNR